MDGRIIFAVIVLCAAATARGGRSTQGVLPEHDAAHGHWAANQRITDDRRIGQPPAVLASSARISDRVLAIGSSQRRRNRGDVRVYYDSGEGFNHSATLIDEGGVLGDHYGASVDVVFVGDGEYCVAVGAPGKDRWGAVFVYLITVDSMMKAIGARRPLTHIRPAQVLLPPVQRIDGNEVYVEQYGRKVEIDAHQLIVSAVSRYKYSIRYEVNVRNIAGTNLFQEETGVAPVAPDPLLVYSFVGARGNQTVFTLLQIIRGDDYENDFGASISVDWRRDVMAVGSATRIEGRFGHGTDGELVVASGQTHFLDADSTYNFDSITVQSGGVLTVTQFDSLTQRGGILNLRVKNKLSVETGAVINVSALGYEGGATSFETTPPEIGKGPGGGLPPTSLFVGFKSCPYDGSSTTTIDTITQINNVSLPFAEANGGGGGYGGSGASGTSVQCGVSGDGGSVYGIADLTTLWRGSGGASGHPWKIGSGGSGGSGGGIIRVTARELVNDGTIECNGGRGNDGGFYSGAGGGGSGGSIYLAGDILTNRGAITATGGLGGTRALGSGSGGHTDVTGGAGGEGRIRIDFTTITDFSAGYINPLPYNATNFTGTVILYRRVKHAESKAVCRWYKVGAVPRPIDMMFVGHKVSLHNSILAIASDELTRFHSKRRVYVFDVSAATNATYLDQIQHIQTLYPPSDLNMEAYPTYFTENFGHELAVWSNKNATLVAVGAPGGCVAALASHSAVPDCVPGSVFLYSIVDAMLFQTIVGVSPYYWREQKILRADNMTQCEDHGDSFGSMLHIDFPFMAVSRKNGMHDPEGCTQLDPYGYVSNGEVTLYRLATNISTEHSYVECSRSEVTLNTSVTCYIVLRDAYNFPAGDVQDVMNPSYFWYPPLHALRFLNRGRVAFEYFAAPSAMGPENSKEVFAVIEGIKLRSFTITLLRAVDPLTSNITVAVENVTTMAGEIVHFEVSTNEGSGSQSAARHFEVFIYNTDDFENVNAIDVWTSPEHGRFFVPPYREEERRPLLRPLKFSGRDRFSFAFESTRPGMYSALVKYQGRPLRFPNPLLVTVEPEPEVSSTLSVVRCPAYVNPNRTMVCIAGLRGASFGGVYTLGDSAINNPDDTGVAAILSSMSISVNGNTIPTYISTPFVLYAGDGQLALVFRPGVEGALQLQFTVGTATLTHSKTVVTSILAPPETAPYARCEQLSDVHQSLYLMRSHITSMNSRHRRVWAHNGGYYGLGQGEITDAGGFTDAFTYHDSLKGTNMICEKIRQ